MELKNIDDVNRYLSPEAAVDSNSGDSTYPEIGGNCNCCPFPKCCPPKLECQSISAYFRRQGYRNPDDSADSDDTLYLKAGYTNTRTRLGESVEEGAPGPPPYLSSTCNYNKTVWTLADAMHFTGYEYTRSYQGGIGDGGSHSGDCPSYPVESGLAPSCSASGTSTQSNYSTACYGDGIEEAIRNYGRDSHYVWTVVDAEGDTTEAFTAWRTEFHTDADYTAAVAAYNAYLAAYAIYEHDYQVWLDGGEVGDVPLAPDLVSEPTGRPTEFYPKCWWKIMVDITIDSHYFGFNSDGSSAEHTPTGSDPTFADWIAGGAAGEPPCSGSGSFNTGYTQHPISALPAPPGSTDAEVPSFLNPVTHAEWVAEVEALIDAEDFPHDSCALTDCSAYREIYTDTYSERFFRYRWKLNKCCGTYSALAWLEVFYSQEFLAWLASSASDPGTAPSTPTSTPKVWAWEGARDAACDGSASDSSPLDLFDSEAHYSPWSMTVRISAGLQGLTRLRSLDMVCYRSKYGTKPDRVEPVTGDLGTYDSRDLNENGIADSQE